MMEAIPTAFDIKKSAGHSVTFSIHGLKNFTHTCKVKAETGNAIMINAPVMDEYEKTKNFDVWIPKRIIKVLNKKKNNFFIELPGWAYETKFLTQENVYHKKWLSLHQKKIK